LAKQNNCRTYEKVLDLKEVYQECIESFLYKNVHSSGVYKDKNWKQPNVNLSMVRPCLLGCQLINMMLQENI
jgi:hypothetical protein